jgi:predicted signal transduction protein with EAL and GGDEF domain
VIDVLSAPFVLDGAEATVGGSVGVAIAAPASTDADGLLREADIAMYSAKAAGRGRFVLFQEHMRAHRPAVLGGVAVALTGQM